MLKLEWDRKFEIGVAKIDFEHKIFFGLIQDYANEVNHKCDVHRLRRILNELKKYAEFHFVSEQNVMFEIKYPALEEHTRLHAELLANLEPFHQDLLAGGVSQPKFVVFLFEWFSFHTAVEDKKIAAFLEGRPT